MTVASLSEVLRVPCRVNEVHRARRQIRELADRAGLSDEATDDVVLAVSEASTNAIQHGCPAGARHIEIRFHSDGRCIEIEIRDSGVFRKRIPMPEFDESHGRGIPLMIALMDEVHITEGTPINPGTVVRLVKCPP